MTDRNNIPRYLRYFKTIQPSEININKEDIFYRDKYSDIINYFKLMLTSSEDLEVFNYIQPKGMLLISISPGTDIHKYLKIISSNYYLDFLELDNLKVLESPDNFFEDFNNILEDLTVINTDTESKVRKETTNQQNKPEEGKKRLVLINQTSNYVTLFNGKSLLNNFLNYWNHDNQRANFNENGTILVWITDDHQEILKNSNELFNVFDLFIKVPILTKIEREAILRSFSEKNPKISFDINTIVSYTENWEVSDLNQLLKVAIFKHFLNSDLNDVSNEITDIIINTIESGEFLPSLNSNMSSSGNNIEKLEQLRIVDGLKGNNFSAQEDNLDIDTIISQIRGERHSDFMLSQLYENAASKNYSELLLVIDKLNKKEPIEDNDRKLLAKYAFILNDTPSRAQINLEKAKKRVDLIKLAFGKEEK